MILLADAESDLSPTICRALELNVLLRSLARFLSLRTREAWRHGGLNVLIKRAIFDAKTAFYSDGLFAGEMRVYTSARAAGNREGDQTASVRCWPPVA